MTCATGRCIMSRSEGAPEEDAANEGEEEELKCLLDNGRLEYRLSTGLSKSLLLVCPASINSFSTLIYKQLNVIPNELKFGGCDMLTYLHSLQLKTRQGAQRNSFTTHTHTHTHIHTHKL